VRRLGRQAPRIGWANPPMHIALAAAFLGGLGLFIGDPDLTVAGRVAAEALAWLLCVRGSMYVAPFAVLAAALLAVAGHATGAGAQFADVLHVLSAGMWAGGILALASLRPPGGWTSPEARTLLERFGRVALIAFAITALTGLLRATEQLNGFGDLWSTAYGVVLVLKAAGVALMLALSLTWRRGRPVAGPEAAAAAVVVGATAMLATFPSPA
jgi:putative copper export protein